MKVFVVIPVRNRSSITCACLSMIQPLMSKGWRVVVVDDGSTDGTVEAVLERFPDVTVLRGDGSLYWTGGVEKGMWYAAEQGAESYVILNDDISVDAETVERVHEQALAEGSLVSGLGKIDMKDGRFEYFQASYQSRFGITNKPLDETAEGLVSVSCCRGNLLAFPHIVVESIGYPDSKNVPHQHGDTDYSLRATRAGFKCYIDPKSIFLEEEVERSDNQSWLLAEVPIWRQIRNAFSKRGVYYPRILLRYYPRHWGAAGCLKVITLMAKMCGIILLRICLPAAVRKRLFAKYSDSYQFYQRRGEDSGQTGS